MRLTTVASLSELPIPGETLPIVWAGLVIPTQVHASHRTPEGVVLDLEIQAAEVRPWGQTRHRQRSAETDWTFL